MLFRSRLSVSALLAAEASPNFRLKPGEICARIAEGYRDAIENGGQPFILMETHPKLRQMAQQDLREPAAFWQRLEAKSILFKGTLPDSVRKAFRKILSRDAEAQFRVLKFPKGLGSLGRRRYLALAEWQGGFIAREAKSVAPSACSWVEGKRAGEGNPWLEKTVRSAVRCEDPYYEVRRGWLVRRLAPDCSRIDIDELVHHEDKALLFQCMGQETANIHLGTPKGRKRILESWKHLPKDWLETASRHMLKLSLKDWRQFKTAGKRKLAA